MEQTRRCGCRDHPRPAALRKPPKGGRSVVTGRTSLTRVTSRRQMKLACERVSSSAKEAGGRLCPSCCGQTLLILCGLGLEIIIGIVTGVALSRYSQYSHSSRPSRVHVPVKFGVTLRRI